MSEERRLANQALTAQNGERILIVDDDPRVLDLLQITLTGRGFGVVTALNGDEAIKRVRSGGVDLMVMDTQLPRRPGLEVLAEIRSTGGYEKFPVILISSNASSEARLEAFRKGADDYVAKPFSPRELILRIRRLLDRLEETRHLSRRVQELESTIARGEKALEDTRAELRNRLFRVGTMFGVLQEVNLSHGIDDLMEHFVSIAVGYLELDVAGLFLVDDREERFACRVVRGWTESRPGVLSFSARGLVGTSLADATRPLSLQTIEGLPEAWEEASRLRAAGMHYLYPVRSAGELRGAIGVSSCARADQSGSDLVAAVAQSIGVALANQRALTAMQRSFLETSSILIRNLEARHTGLEGHSDRVAAYAENLAARARLSLDEIEDIRLGAQLHDLGLVEIYEALEIPDLDEAARLRVVEAPIRAATTIAGEGPLETVAAIVRHHHEHWDGRGYPDGLAGESIPIGARIVCIANAMDALVHDRPYRPAYSLEDAIGILEADAGKEYDPELVRLFVTLLREGKVAVG